MKALEPPPPPPPNPLIVGLKVANEMIRVLHATRGR